MGEIVQATELEVGDLYRDYRPASKHYPGRTVVHRVTGVRTVRYVETYRVLETLSIDGRDLRGEISLRSDVTVERLEQISHQELIDGVLAMMRGGDTAIVTYYDMKLWV